LKQQLFWALCLLLLTAGVGAESADEKFAQLAREFLDGYLELNPETATTLGEHRWDGCWSDVSRAGVERSRLFQLEYLRRCAELADASLGPENRVDRAILEHHLRSQLWSLDELREYSWNPLLYNPGPALYALVARDYAPWEQRLQALAARLEGMPAWLGQARSMLRDSPEIHCRTAIAQNAGSLSFVEKDLDEFVVHASLGLQKRLAAARQAAAQALKNHGQWLEQDLLLRAHYDFRLGPERWARKLYFTLESDISPEALAKRAEQDLRETQAAMVAVARQLAPQAAQLSDHEVCRKVLDELANEHPTSENIVSLAEACLQRATDFVGTHQLVTLPPEPCKIVEMPEFNRGVAIAYCDSPGPLEKASTPTYYAIAPTPKDWSSERSLSFYREYNCYMLDDLTVHEATPGHFLQLMHANRFVAPTRLRAVMQSGTFVEGWATYAEQMMVEHGYGGPKVKMQQLKMRLRLILNALLDQKVHLQNWQEDQVVAWLRKEGFQEEGEATGKWRRACLTSCQLSTYYVGNVEVNDLVRDYRLRFPQHKVGQMHDKILSFGSPAVRHIRRLLSL
jgi:uncharacterized protein (DUF885 family)